MTLDPLQKQQIREWCDEAIEEATETGAEVGEIHLPATWVAGLLDEIDEAGE